MLTRFRSRKYLQRIILTLVFFIILVIGVFAFTMYWNMKNTTLQIQTEANRKVLAQVKYNVEYMDEIVKNLIMSLYFDNEVIPILYGQTFRYEEIANKLAKLDKVADSSTYLHSITLYNSFTKKYLSTNRSFQDNLNGEIQRYEQQLALLPDLPKLKMIPIKLFGNPQTAVDFFSYIIYENSDGDPANKSKLILNVKPEWLFNNIKSINDLAYDRNNSILLLDSQGNIYSEENHLAELVPAELKERINSSNAEFESFTFGKGHHKSIVTIMSLGVYQWKVISIQSYDFAFSQLIKIRNILIISTLLFLALSAVIAFIISQRLYRPVERIISQLKGSSYSEAESTVDKDEWSYLSNVYTNLVHKMNNVKQHHSRNKKIVEDFHIRSLLTESASLSKNQFNLMMNELDLQIHPEGPFLVGVMKIDDYRNKVERASASEQEIYRFAIGNITEELLSGCSSFIWNYAGNDLIVFLATPRTAQSSFDLSAFRSAIKELQQVIHAFYRLSITVSYTSPFSDYTHIADAHVEARDLILYRMFYGTGTILTADLVNTSERLDELNQGAELEKKIVDELRRGNSAEMERNITAFFEWATSLTYTPFMHAVLQLTITVSKAVSEVNEIRLRVINIDLVDLHKKVLEKETSEDIESLFRSLASQISDKTDPGQHTKIDVLCQTIKEIIEENCTDVEFYQQTIAQLLKMSSAYIGRVFKQGTGMAITEYINDIRLEKALILLEADNMTINEIMERVGYRSQSHFFKLFKTKYGTTPKEYRLKKAISGDG
ncbi:helix-turn-helix domain-containing protein [Cohnella abietis]|uniref:HTH araC/xylS-type domain-containing protein n=1 Tax=Cohnella abietis TaxID=2507935 RepID=A0A3T1DBW4_9BACL|nr:helix-turn-helix domain-containing protein [Cohnella abietis]BBI35534.1 hypothetical protein KCTCHS21_49330 [Cohnella abietis]